MIDCPTCGHPNIEGADQCEQCQADLSGLGVPDSSSEGLAARLMSGSVMELQPARGLTMLPENTVSEVTQSMIDQHTSGVMIVYQDELVGIFTERDFLMKIADRYERLRQEPIRKFMSPLPEALQTTDSVALGLNLMAVKNYRHVPIMKDNQPVAMVRTRDVLGFIASQYSPVN
jgi:CBS domain-containing protein